MITVFFKRSTGVTEASVDCVMNVVIIARVIVIVLELCVERDWTLTT